MRKASTRLPEQGTQTPSPAPDLIPAETENQPRTNIETGTANGGTSASLTAPDVPSTGGICKAVVIAAKYVPGATCLIRCLVARGMLARYGFTAQIRIGVLKDSSTLQANAWLENNGSILVQLGSPLNQ